MFVEYLNVWFSPLSSLLISVGSPSTWVLIICDCLILFLMQPCYKLSQLHWLCCNSLLYSSYVFCSVHRLQIIILFSLLVIRPLWDSWIFSISHFSFFFHLPSVCVLLNMSLLSFNSIWLVLHIQIQTSIRFWV